MLFLFLVGEDKDLMKICLKITDTKSGKMLFLFLVGEDKDLMKICLKITDTKSGKMLFFISRW